MKVVFRTHINSIERFELLNKTIESYTQTRLLEVYETIVVDDHSSMMSDEIFKLCSKYQISYIEAQNKPSPINGFVESLRVVSDKNEFNLLCVDDIIFSSQFAYQYKELLLKLSQFSDEDLSTLGMVGFFACYPEGVRNDRRFKDLELWNINHEIFYATVCHLISPIFSNIIQEDYRQVLSGSKPFPAMPDDIYTAVLGKQHNMTFLNTMKDYVQHTGVSKSSLGHDVNKYVTEVFVD